MSRWRLTNDDWGLESNCFVCEARNNHGLQLELWADDGTRQVDTTFTLGHAFSGAPTLVHGGLSLAILDEVQAWAVIAHERTWAVTVETASTFVQPVWVDQAFTARADIVSRDGDTVKTRGWIEDAAGGLCVRSTATFLAIGEATAASLIGDDVPEEHRGFLRQEDPANPKTE